MLKGDCAACAYIDLFAAAISIAPTHIEQGHVIDREECAGYHFTRRAELEVALIHSGATTQIEGRLTMECKTERNEQNEQNSSHLTTHWQGWEKNELKAHYNATVSKLD